MQCIYPLNVNEGRNTPLISVATDGQAVCRDYERPIEVVHFSIT